MGYMISLSFCEVCGKQTTSGERFCPKHRSKVNERKDELDSDKEEKDSLDEYLERDSD